MKIAVFHPGTQHSRQVARALEQLGRLAFLATGLFSDGRPGKLALPGPLRTAWARERARFAFTHLDPASVRTFPLTELPERLAARAGWGGAARVLDRLGNAAMGRHMGRIVEREGPLALWGFDSSSFAAFADPRCAAVPRILDRTIADGRHWNAELATLRQTHPRWLDDAAQPWSTAKLVRDDSEYANATHIVCGSDFAAETLRRHAPLPDLAHKLHVLPYPFDEALFGGADAPRPAAAGGPVRFLFVGAVGVRKGVHLLLEAFAALSPAEATLTLAGPIAVPRAVLAAHAGRAQVLGPVARAAIPGLMRDHDVVVLPSLFEGSAVVLAEAMASGLALIHSAASGAGASNHSGIVLPRPEAPLLQQAMQCLCSDRDRLHAMRLAAWRESHQRSFAVYRDRLAALLAEWRL